MDNIPDGFYSFRFLGGKSKFTNCLYVVLLKEKTVFQVHNVTWHLNPGKALYEIENENQIHMKSFTM